jgi:hypothetical protein
MTVMYILYVPQNSVSMLHELKFKRWYFSKISVTSFSNCCFILSYVSFQLKYFFQLSVKKIRTIICSKFQHFVEWYLIWRPRALGFVVIPLSLKSSSVSKRLVRHVNWCEHCHYSSIIKYVNDRCILIKNSNI